MKQKFLLRKDVCFPSAEMLTLEDMKKRLNWVIALTDFTRTHQEVFERKIIKLGQCCEVYSDKKAPHPLGEHLGFSIFKRSKYRNESQEWKLKD
jgi:hypothetical protein